MNNFTTTFLNRLKGITLSNNERLAMRERLALYADMHTVADGVAAGSAYGGIFTFIMSRRFSGYALGLMLLVAAGGGITLAADGSAPGDALYAIKINVNEPVMTALAPTAAGQAKVAAELATRRVDEAVTLASRGTLTTERQTYLADQFAVRIQKAAAKADELASTGDTAGADTIKANLAANLAGEAQALGAVTTNNSEESAHLLGIIVATSEDISNAGMDNSGAIATALPNEDTAPATTTQPVAAPARAMGVMMAKTASTSTTTEQTLRARAALRLTRQLHLTASTTLRGHLFSGTDIFNSKADVAIPQKTEDSQAATVLSPESLGGGASFGD